MRDVSTTCHIGEENRWNQHIDAMLRQFRRPIGVAVPSSAEKSAFARPFWGWSATRRHSETGPMPTPEQVALFRITPIVISVLDYGKGFGHTDLVTCA
jgi:hypothetical protein